jgi:tetratricopeptide (TPR) repeat protein
LLELEKEPPGDPRTQELLGHIAWSTKHSDEAQRYWATAVERGSQDFETLYQLALLLHGTGTPRSQVTALIQRAVTVNPDSDEAIYNLGVLQYGEGQYEAASQTLLRLGKITPERAYSYYSVLAYCGIKTKNFDRAKAFLLKAAASARTAEEQGENSQMMRFGARAD